MHAQIKEIISNMRVIDGGRVAVDFTCGERTPLGRVLHDMYYRTRLTELLDREDYNGYPHNGGVHSFRLTCKPLDAIAFVETLKETFEDKLYLGETRQVVLELSYISQELYGLRRLIK